MEIAGHGPFVAERGAKLRYDLEPWKREDSVGPAPLLATVLTVAVFRLAGIGIEAGELPFRSPGDGGARLSDADVAEVWRLAEAIRIRGPEPPPGCYSVSDPAERDLRPKHPEHAAGRVYRHALDAEAEARRLRGASGHGYSTMRHETTPAWATEMDAGGTAAKEDRC